jgi:hypothetical protein
MITLQLGSYNEKILFSGSTVLVVGRKFQNWLWKHRSVDGIIARSGKSSLLHLEDQYWIVDEETAIECDGWFDCFIKFSGIVRESGDWKDNGDSIGAVIAENTMQCSTGN